MDRENKKMIMFYLRDALQYTRGGSNVMRLEYKKLITEDEVVIIHFKSGFTKTVNVTADSGIAMMRDVLKAL